MSTTVEQLRAARALVERGWCQGVLARNKNGKKCGHRSKHAVCFCALGALYRGGLEYWSDRFLHDAAEKLGAVNPVCFNDAPGRTQAEVLALFDEAIALATQEQADG